MTLATCTLDPVEGGKRGGVGEPGSFRETPRETRFFPEFLMGVFWSVEMRNGWG